MMYLIYNTTPIQNCNQLHKCEVIVKQPVTATVLLFHACIASKKLFLMTQIGLNCQ